MYFLWKRTPHGMIRISCDGLSDFVRGFLNPQSRLYSLAVAELPAGESGPFPSVPERPEGHAGEGGGPLSGGERLMTLVLSPHAGAVSRDPSYEPRVERRISLLVRPLGLISSVVWISRGSPSAEWAEVWRAVLGNPWVWMALASSIALVAIAGWAGFFWTAFWGTAAWFLVRSLLFLMGRGSFLRAASKRS